VKKVFALMKKQPGQTGYFWPLWLRIYRDIVHANDTPGRIAGGVAIGVIMGIMPTFGLGTVLAGVLAAVFRFNVVAALAGSVTGIPIAAPLIWLASSIIGGLLMGLSWKGMYVLVKTRQVLDAGKEVIMAYLLGNLVLTVIVTSLSYVLVLLIVRAHQQSVIRRTLPQSPPHNPSAG